MWSQTDLHLHPPKQTQFWWENAHWIISHNRQDAHAAVYQPGGKGLVTANQLFYQAQCPGVNTTGLGNWCSWAHLHSKHNQMF